jgi:uncharacterized membrane protein YphA (DoxX/SURF4 family)
MLAQIRSLSDRVLGLLRKITWTGPLLVRLTLGLVFVTTGWGRCITSMTSPSSSRR